GRWVRRHWGRWVRRHWGRWVRRHWGRWVRGRGPLLSRRRSPRGAPGFGFRYANGASAGREASSRPSAPTAHERGRVQVGRGGFELGSWLSVSERVAHVGYGSFSLDGDRGGFVPGARSSHP